MISFSLVLFLKEVIMDKNENAIQIINVKYWVLYIFEVKTLCSY